MRGKLLALTGSAALGALLSSPAHAGFITLNDGVGGGCGGACEGLTYTLEQEIPNAADPLTAEFVLKITGENVLGTDTRFTGLPGNGRTGINGISFNTVSKTNPNTGMMEETIINGVTTLAPNTGFTFKPGGLASGGCDGTGGFYCFDNINIPPIPASPLITGNVFLNWDVTLTSGTWADYATALKIDWVGSANNYSLVSKDIPVNVNNCPDCVINPTGGSVPEPGSLMLLGTALVGWTGFFGWRRRKEGNRGAC